MGWPGSWLEDYVDQPQAFQAQLVNLVSHGVFQKFPGLKVVLGESGITWLPSFLWRFSKNWRGGQDGDPMGGSGTLGDRSRSRAADRCAAGG